MYFCISFSCDVLEPISNQQDMCLRWPLYHNELKVNINLLFQLSGKGRPQTMQGWYRHQQSRDAQDDEEEEEEEEDEEVSHSDAVDYREQYKRLKRKLKYLIYVSTWKFK